MAKHRVLIIDDSLTIRALLEGVISRHSDFRVVGAASSVASARQMMTDLLPTVITLDLAMPDVDGIGFLDELVKQRHAPILVLSSSTTAGSAARDEALLHGAHACFDKARILSDSAGLLRRLKATADGNWHLAKGWH